MIRYDYYQAMELELLLCYGLIYYISKKNIRGYEC